MSSGISIGNTHRKPTLRDKGKSLTDISSSFTVIDIETTGLDPKVDKIIEIGAIKVNNGSIIDKFESLIKPDEPHFYVNSFITELTGITNDMLYTAPTIEEVLPKFLSFIGNDILLGHNVNFDINFLYDSSLELLDHHLQNDFMDLMRFTRKVFPHFENHKLVTVAENFEIDTSNSHRALEDCDITYRCFSKLSNHLDENNIILKELFPVRYSSLDVREIKSSIDVFDVEHILFDKNCTFTGTLEKMNRKDAAQLVANFGGNCLNGVTRKTNFLILGNFDYSSNVKGDKSSKLKKAEELILKGQDLQILSEDVFYDLVNEKPFSDGANMGEQEMLDMLLQERVKEWDSGILDIYDDKIKITGFMSSERLLDYHDRGSNCIFGTGLYPVLQFDTSYAKDNGLWIILEDGKEVSRSQFIPIIKDSFNYKDSDNKVRSKVFTVRKCFYTNRYNFKDTEKSSIFDTLKELENYLQVNYGFDLFNCIKKYIEVYLYKPFKQGRIRTKYVRSIYKNIICDEIVNKCEESKSDTEKQLEIYKIELDALWK